MSLCRHMEPERHRHVSGFLGNDACTCIERRVLGLFLTAKTLSKPKLKFEPKKVIMILVAQVHPKKNKVELYRINGNKHTFIKTAENVQASVEGAFLVFYKGKLPIEAHKPDVIYWDYEEL